MQHSDVHQEKAHTFPNSETLCALKLNSPLNYSLLDLDQQSNCI
jgi:hypothetical protein